MILRSELEARAAATKTKILAIKTELEQSETPAQDLHEIIDILTGEVE